MCNVAACLGKRRWGRGGRGKKQGRGSMLSATPCPEMLVGCSVWAATGRRTVRMGKEHTALAGPGGYAVCGSGALPDARVGHSLRLGLKMSLITSAAHLGGGFVLCRAPIQPCSPGGLLPPPACTQHRCLGQLLGWGGLRGQQLSSLPPYPSPLHFNTPPPPPACLHSSKCSEHYQCLHFCHCLCELCFKGNKVKLCLLTRKAYFSPSLGKPVLALKHDTNHPCKP